VKHDSPNFELEFLAVVFEFLSGGVKTLASDEPKRRFSYDGLAESWVDMFRQYIAEKAMREIGKFEGVL
jgi:hypothetical protein